MYDLETQRKVAEWRRKSIDGTITLQEMVEATLHLTAGRRSAAAASTAAKSTRTKTAQAMKDLPDGDALLNEMLGNI